MAGRSASLAPSLLNRVIAMKNCLAVLAAIALLPTAAPTAALADNLLDRYGVASDAKAEQMRAFYISRVPEMADVMPEMGWDDAIAAVTACTLNGVRQARGEEAAEAYVAAMEAWAAIPVNSFGDMAEGLSGALSDDLAIRLAQDCGALDLSMQRMQDSGMMALVQQPGVMERLMAE